MQLLDNVIILLLIIGAFIAGKVMADRYNERIVAELQYQLRLNAAQNGVGYVPARPISLRKPATRRPPASSTWLTKSPTASP